MCKLWVNKVFSILAVITEVIELPFLKNILHVCDRLGTANTRISAILTLMNWFS